MQESSTEVETATVSPGSAYDLEAAPKLDHRQEKVHQIALAYAAAFPHAGVKALEAHIAMVGLGGEIAAGMDEAIARAGFELTRSRVMLLRLLYFAEGRQLYLNEVAREMAVSAAAVSQLVDSLARDGWVERVVSPLDRRFTFAKLTAAFSVASFINRTYTFLRATGGITGDFTTILSPAGLNFEESLKV